MEKKHTVFVDSRKEAEVSGVVSILSFDDEVLLLELENDRLLIGGRELRVLDMSRDSGNVKVAGNIEEIRYTEGKKKRK